MMSEWWTYRPEDLLLFSERVYWRLFELHNAAVWPAQIVAFGLGAAMFLFVVQPRPQSNRVAALILAAAWMFVAWAFLWNSYATINWAARWAAPLFVFEALLLAWIGGLRGALEWRGPGNALGLALFLYALAVHPLIAVFAGRPLAAAEVFGVAPDPTVIATLGLVAMAKGRGVSLLLVVPLAWCAASWLTLRTMGAWEAWIPFAAVPVALAARGWQRIQERREGARRPG
jgi:hypothetical protein